MAEQLVQSVDRSLKLLVKVADLDKGSGVGVRELARATGLKVSTAQNLLKTLVANGFLEFDADARKYRVGLAAVLLGDRADPLERMSRFAQPWVDALHEALGETVAVAAWVRGRAMVVDWRQAERSLAVAHSRRLVTDGGMATMAIGRVLLAYADEATQVAFAERAVAARAGKGLPRDAKEFLEMLAAIRGRGWTETRDVGGSGIAAFAAPVLDGSGRADMAISCSAPLARWDAGACEPAREAVSRAADEMSAGLGWRT